MKGEKPKPAIIKMREGNRSKVAKSAIKQDPQGIGTPRIPAHLTEIERDLWLNIVKSLPTGLLSSADNATLERMAIAWAEFREVQETIRKTGKLVQSAIGPIRNPLLIVREKAAREMHSAGEVLGLSPVARARLSATDSGEADPLALLLGDDMDPDGAWSTLPRTRQ